MATNTQLDAIADRLGALYQHVGRMMPDETDQPKTWNDLLNEIVSLTREVEASSGRAKRARNERKRARRAERQTTVGT